VICYKYQHTEHVMQIYAENMLDSVPSVENWTFASTDMSSAVKKYLCLCLNVFLLDSRIQTCF